MYGNACDFTRMRFELQCAGFGFAIDKSQNTVLVSSDEESAIRRHTNGPQLIGNCVRII
jgi:hypothetical protein